MNVYKRPMFLQGGGPSAPMAATPMAAPPPNAGAGAGIPPELQMALEGAKQEGNAIGQGIGQKFVADMMQGLEGAEDYEQAINAIRGNDLPLSARYDELGEIVGEEDAKETPESVLALVQPAIMMTEEGAMNSGIGNLMQELTGDVAMEGPMEEGVGSLMAAGQPAEPPMPPGPDPTALGPIPNGTPQGFAVGGAVNRFRGSPVVQNFAKGTDVTIAGRGDIPDPLRPYLNYEKPEGFLEGSLQEAYEDRLKLYEKVGGRDPAADKAQFWAQMAQLGLNLAAPPPELRGRSPAEALAAAAKVPFANIAKLGQRASEGKRATRFAALQAAETAETARKKQLAASELERRREAITAAKTISEQQQERDLLGPESRQAFAEKMQIKTDALKRELASLAGDQSLAAIAARGKLEAELARTNNSAAQNRQELIGSQYMSRLQVKHGHEIMMARTAREQMSEYQKATLGLKEKGLALQKQVEDRLFRHGSAKILQEEDRIKYQEDYRAAVLAGDKKKEENLVAWRMKQAEDTMASRDALAAYRRAVLAGDTKKQADLVAHRMKQMEDALVDRNSLAEYRKAVLAGDTKKQSDLISWRMRQAENAQVDRNSLAEYRKLELGYKQQLLGYKQAALNMSAFGKSLKGNVLKILTNTDNLDLYAQNKLDAQATAELNAAITFWAEEKPVWNALANPPRYEMKPGHRLPNGVLRAMDARRPIKDAVTPNYKPSDERTWGPGQTEEGVDALPVPEAMTLTGTGTGTDRAESQGETPLMPNISDVAASPDADAQFNQMQSDAKRMTAAFELNDIEKAFGFVDAFVKGFGWTAAHVKELFGGVKPLEWFRGPSRVSHAIKTANTMLIMGIKKVSGDRLTQPIIEKLEDRLPNPSAWKSNTDAAEEFRNVATWLQGEVQNIRSALDTTGLSPTESIKRQNELRMFNTWREVYETGARNLRGEGAQGPMENAPTSVFTVGNPDYELNKVPGYDPAEHKAFQDRGEDYRAYLTGN